MTARRAASALSADAVIAIARREAVAVVASVLRYGPGEDLDSVPEGIEFLPDDVLDITGLPGVLGCAQCGANVGDLVERTHGSPSVDGPDVASSDLAAESSVGAAPGVEPSTTPGATQGGAA